MKEITWRITPDGMPAVLRRCPKCEKQRRFACSGNFRLNSNQRKMDVWLIYRCEHCDSTLNLDVYTRVEPLSLDPEHYNRLRANDKELAAEFANDASFLRRNKASPDFEGVGFNVEGEDLPRGEKVRLTIECAFAAGIRLDKLLADRTGLTRGEIGRMAARGDISSPSGDVTKLKPKDTIVLEITL